MKVSFKPGTKLRVIDSYSGAFINFQKGMIFTFSHMYDPKHEGYICVEEIRGMGFHISHFEEVKTDESKI